MLFCFYNLDAPDRGAIRKAVVADHKAYLKQSEARIAFAGPLFAEDGATPKGSLLVMDFADLAAARTWLAAEPYTMAGLYGSTSITHYENRWPQRVGFPAA